MELIEPGQLRPAELFFHVFAHVEGTRGLPASVHDAGYVAWCGTLLGAASSRTLAEDARLLALAFPSHVALARVQGLARLVGSLERFRAMGSRALAQLTAADVDDVRVLADLQTQGDPAELALCALLLELASFESLPPVPPVPEELRRRLTELAGLAPGLSDARIACVRSLGHRGRVWGREIWIGHPSAEVAPSVEHAGWQAAHEASVVAVARAQPELSERAVEARAVELLAERAQRAGEGPSHARWLASVSGGL